MTPFPLAAAYIMLLLAIAWVVGRRRRVLRWATPVAAGMAAVVLALVWRGIGEPVEWDAATVLDARTVRVSYDGGECEDQRSVSVDEDARTVTIGIVTRSFATSCSDVAMRHSVLVHLDRPLGDRALIDRQCNGARSACTRVPTSER